MKKYALNCPDALKNPKKGTTISTQFIYYNLEDALDHKKACDEWAEMVGKKPRAYIEIIED